MNALSSLLQFQTQLTQNEHRSAVCFNLDDADSKSLIQQYIHHAGLSDSQIAWFGKKEDLVGDFEYDFFDYKQGAQILGQEVELLIFDLSAGFDANSFTAACGALKAGGLLFIINSDQLVSSHSKTWLRQHLTQWPQVESLDSPLFFSSDDNHIVEPSLPTVFIKGKTQDQLAAIEGITKVLSGHRKRPLVLTAHRGRGKSACLGMAAAQLMSEHSRTIIITAPSIKSLSSVFSHAITQLNHTKFERGIKKQNRTSLELDNGSRLLFIAPDELLLNKPECDLLLVDEAAALPLSMLKRMVRHYHRMVFSSTVHGYEGCGRGFTLKFMSWLDENRDGWKHQELLQPIRWQQNDPLELWLFDTFLLASDITPAPTSCIDIQLQLIDKEQLLNQPALLRSVFELLVNAHYQTTPNDLFQLLDDQAMSLYIIQSQGSLLGCIVINLEGGLSPELVTEIQQGKRRPKGHLVASHLSNHLSIEQAAIQTSARIMRIAVHPECQRQGIGQQALNLLQLQLIGKVDFISTSFGATSELIRFWSEQFSLVKLGSHRDQASGCYSAVMIAPLSFDAQTWLESAHARFGQEFKFLLSNVFQYLEVDVVMAILSEQISKSSVIDKSPLVENYLQGGNSFESVHFELDGFVWQRFCGRYQPLNMVGLDCLVSRVLQQQSWKEVGELCQLSGRKMIEQQIKQIISFL